MEDKTNIFIQKSRIIHSEKYDYSKSCYVNAHTKLYIICPIHGEFFMRPNSHLNGQGCKKCGIEQRPQNNPKPLEMFIADAIKIYGNKYDYSNVRYIDNSTLVEIICSEHGSFYKRPNSHLDGQGCPQCGRNQHKSVNDYPHDVKMCKSCNIEKPILEYYIDGEYFRGNCKECEKKIKVEYRQDPENKKRLRNYHKTYRNNRRKTDPVFRLRMDIPTIIRRSIKKKYYNDSIWNYLPYTPLELKTHLETKFDGAMTWDNHGSYWHIDHIIPQAAFHYDSESHPDFIKCWNLENLRPLKAIDNMHKSSIYNGQRISKRYL